MLGGLRNEWVICCTNQGIPCAHLTHPTAILKPNLLHWFKNLMSFATKFQGKIYMGGVISKYDKSRDNNYNLIRFIAAILVLYSHSFPLSGTNDAEPFASYTGITAGTVAVDAFFISSGFLVASSFFERANIIAFIWDRLLRIFPALIGAMLFCVFIVGLYFSRDSWSLYLYNAKTYKFLLKNITLFFGIEFNLPGVFSDTPFKSAVNGSLWTLPYEVKMYLFLAKIGSILIHFQKSTSRNILKIIFFSIALISISIHILNHFYLFTSVEFIRLFSKFFIGVAFYVFRAKVILSSRVFILIFSALLISLLNKDIFFIIYSISLPYLLIYIAYIPSGFIRYYNKAGDYSYGMYIYAFPVQQSIAEVIPKVTVNTMITLSLIATLMLSILSWHTIEKKFLKLKENYIYLEKILRRSV